MHFQGSYVALVTPFHEDGSVNFDKLKELCEWHAQNGTDGVVVLGTTGESSTMTHVEDEQVVQCAIDTLHGRIPVIAGSGSNCTETALMKSRAYKEAGADALLLITPYYNKTNERGMYRHFATVAEQVNLPIIIYNVPGRTGCSISVECMAALSKLKNIAAVKEASGNISYVAKIAKYVNDDFALLSGNDDMILPILSLGGSGVISVLANVCPRQTHDMVVSFLEGDRAKALDLQLKLLDLINALFIEVNPIPVKEAMNMLGMEVGGYRLPLEEMSDEHKAVLREKIRVIA